MADKLETGEMTERSKFLIREYLNQRVELHRRKNDGDLDPVKTAVLRGRIAECRNLLSQLDRSGATIPDDYL